MKAPPCALDSHRARTVYLTLCCLCLSAHPGKAQDRSFPYAVGKQDLVLVPLGLGMKAWGSALRDGRDPITREEISRLTRGDINWFDRPATYNSSSTWENRSDTYRDVNVRGTLVLLVGEATYALTQRQWAAPAVMAAMFGELYLLIEGSAFLAKGAVGRKRPYAYNTALSVDERYGMSDSTEVYFSFFSGHAAAAFTAATFSSTIFTDIHGTSTWSYLMWGTTLSLATLTAYARVEAGVHYPSDVIAGAIVGGAIGYLVPALHRKDAGDRLGLVAGPERLGLRVRF
jgi:membrane-associated phospholipid phosphatase